MREITIIQPSSPRWVPLHLGVSVIAPSDSSSCYADYVQSIVRLAIQGCWVRRLGMYPVEQASGLVPRLGLIAEKGHCTVERRERVCAAQAQFVDIPGNVMIAWPVVQTIV